MTHGDSHRGCWWSVLSAVCCSLLPHPQHGYAGQGCVCKRAADARAQSLKVRSGQEADPPRSPLADREHAGLRAPRPRAAARTGGNPTNGSWRADACETPPPSACRFSPARGSRPVVHIDRRNDALGPQIEKCRVDQRQRDFGGIALAPNGDAQHVAEIDHVAFDQRQIARADDASRWRFPPPPIRSGCAAAPFARPASRPDSRPCCPGRAARRTDNCVTRGSGGIGVNRRRSPPARNRAGCSRAVDTGRVSVRMAAIQRVRLTPRLCPDSECPSDRARASHRA